MRLLSIEQQKVISFCHLKKTEQETRVLIT